MNPLNTRTGAILTGLVLAIVVAVAVKSGFALNIPQLVRWLHIVAGITWIGLLYYFNFVQIPALAAAAADKGGPGGAGISKYVAPAALLWFRWAAVATWLTGAYYLEAAGYGIANALTLQPAVRIIGIGAWLGTIMLINVWVFIWPNQKKVLGLAPATDEQKAKARRIAFIASRTNTILSLPMLMCMTGQLHGLPF